MEDPTIDEFNPVSHKLYELLDILGFLHNHAELLEDWAEDRYLSTYERLRYKQLEEVAEKLEPILRVSNRKL